MKIRKGFVTNSSSTNFGVMVITSIAGISAAALISPYEFDQNAKKKSYVRLVVEAPVRKVLRPGQNVTISAQVLKVEIVDGELSDDVTVVGGATISCASGAEIIEMETPSPDSNDGSLSFTVIDDLEALLKYDKPILFNISAICEGENLSASLNFTVPYFTVSPIEGNFVLEKDVSMKLNLRSNYGSDYSYNFSEGSLLSSDVLDRDEMSQTINISEDVDDPDKVFNKFTCKVIKDYKIDAPGDGFSLSGNFRGTFLKESILLPKSTKLPVILKSYKDDQSDKRTDEAHLLYVKVLKYDDATKNLKIDLELTNNLSFDFEPTQTNGRLDYDSAKKIVDTANIISELLPDKGAATDQQGYAIYRIYANAFVESEEENIDMIITVSCDDSDIEDITLKGQLKPRISLKGLIRQFIEYPQGTYIGVLAKLGDVDIYFNALDELTEIKLVGSGNPQYEPNSDSMLLREIPESIKEFLVVQTIHHELAHKIERINGESFSRFQKDAYGERHSYFIQYLSDAAKALADIERGVSSDIEAGIGEAIHKYNQVYYNVDNLEYPPNEGEISSWFGVRTLSQHEVFDRYRDFSIHCMNGALPDNIKRNVEKYVESLYFPGDIKGYWKEIGGLFDGGEWSMSWQGGNVFKIIPRHKGYTFTEMSRRWLGGNRLAFEARYLVIRESDKDEDELIAVFDAGTFDSSNWAYPKIDKFTLKWKAGRTLSDCLLGDHMDKEVELIRK